MPPGPKNPGSSQPSPAPGDGATFEQSIEEVEAIIERIEGGEAGLEQSIEQYERGMKLLRRCRDILQQAEQRVEELNKALGGPGGEDKKSPEGKNRPMEEDA